MAHGKPGRPRKVETVDPLAFNHDKPAAQATNEGVRCLIQDGRMYSFGEFNPFTKKYEPEPKLLDNYDMSVDRLTYQVGALKTLIGPVAKEIARLSSICDKLDAIARGLRNG